MCSGIQCSTECGLAGQSLFMSTRQNMDFYVTWLEASQPDARQAGRVALMCEAHGINK